MSTTIDADVSALLEPWSGPFGGLPPFDRASPAAIGRAYEIAIAQKREEIRTIAENPAVPTFENTIEALEDSGRALARVDCLYRVYSSSMSDAAMGEVASRVAPLAPALENEIACDDRLYARIAELFGKRATSGLNAEQQRLVEVIHERMVRAGAKLATAERQRLTEINRRLSALSAAYNRNLIAEQDEQGVFLEDEADLAGLPEPVRTAAATAALAKGRAGIWAVPNQRSAVWAFLTHSTRRELRERIWRMWTSRGDNSGERDNKPLIAEILRLRGEKARLLGHETFAHFALADRMARTPEAAMTALTRTWGPVLAVTKAQIAGYQAIADEEGLGAKLAPWDRLHYAEKLRRRRFGVAGDAIKEYLTFDGMIEAMFWAAGRLYGLSFRRLTDIPLVHPSCRAYEVRRGDGTVGLLYMDLFHRAGKMHGSYQLEYRSAESFRGRVLPISSINSGLPPPPPGQAALMPWEYANVFFHEFGHALHMLCNSASYPSLGSMRVAWDFIELPALLNERWLLDRDLLARFARHHLTGAPIPAELVNRLERALAFDRVFSANLDYLAGAIVDLRLHLMADGRPDTDIDAVRVEAEILAQLDMPPAWDQIMRVTHNFHVFIGEYAAGLYAYLWADVMAADVAEKFLSAPGGLYDVETAESWCRSILGAGHTLPADEAFRIFRGRDPDPDALLRRFGLDRVAV